MLFQGLLSFLSAPLIGALSDIWGRKPFLLLTVTFTCAPIPLMKFSPWSVLLLYLLQSFCLLITYADGNFVCESDTSLPWLSWNMNHEFLSFLCGNFRIT